MGERAYDYRSDKFGFDLPVPPSPAGYRAVGRIFQAFPPAGITWPEQVIDALRRDLDPQLCPMWCWTVYRAPDGGEQRVGRHWLWLEVPWPDGPYVKYNYARAQTGPNVGRNPNILFHPLQTKATDEELEMGLGGEFLPFTWGVYEWLKAARDGYVADADARADVLEASEQAEDQKRMTDLHEDTENRWKDDRLWLNKMAMTGSTASESDILKAAQHGNVRWEPKPFVFMRSEKKDQ